MGEIVRINAGSKARGFEGVSKLRTQLSGGGTCLWVPSHDVQLGTKHITENGTYSAASEQLYGYSSVEVDVNPEVNQLTGKKQDGNEYTVTKDGSGGLDETKVPSTIKVTKLPNVTTYGVGAFLGFDGIEVTAYYGDGSSYGVIPFEDLVFPVIQAPWEPSGDVTEASTSDLGFSYVTQPFHTVNEAGETISGTTDGKTWTTIHKYTATCKMACFLSQSGDRVFVIASKEQGKEITRRSEMHTTSGTVVTDTTVLSTTNSSYIYDGKTVYYGWVSIGAVNPNAYDVYGFDGNSSSISLAGQNNEIRKIAWTMIYGIITSEGGFQVPVQWNRPDDGKTLETSYGITVVAGPSGNDS